MAHSTLQPPDSATAGPTAVPMVRHLRQVLLWPLQLLPAPGAQGQRQQHARPWRVLRDLGEATPWRELVDEYAGAGGRFQERHYNEFVSFLPVVQRFLYGQGRARREAAAANPRRGEADSPMRVFRRHDITQVRVQTRPDAPVLTLDIAHIDLYFFFDVDMVLLNVEVMADDLPLPLAEDLLYRFGRAYPSGWDDAGMALHCLHSAEWLGADGQVLAQSDTHQREAFLAHVAERRAPRMAAHWAYVMQPLVAEHAEPTDGAGLLRFRQIEYYRMPMMAFIAVDEPAALSRNDFVRLGLVTGAAGLDGIGEGGHLPEFEARHCYDRFWVDTGAAPRTRYVCSGHALVVVGDAQAAFYTCRERGVLAQFRHQHFLLFLIAHFQKSALLMFSDRLVEALQALNVASPGSVRRFKRSIRGSFEVFLRFTHRYWFHEVSEQAHVRALFHLTTQHLGVDPLYSEVKERIADMNSYLDADSLRRQANTVVRLTVVTIFGLIGTITTGFLGMNLLAEAEAPWSRRVFIFMTVFVTATALTFYTMAKSKRLSDFLDDLSDEQLPWWRKAYALARVWLPRRD